MSLTFINKKFEKLQEKEQIINNFYDPVKRHKKQHHNINDLRADYKEDLQNYGFSKHQLKRDIEQQKEDEQIISDYQQREQQDKSQTKNVQIQQKKNIRPVTAGQRPGQYKQLRPTTAPMQNREESVIEEQDEDPFLQHYKTHVPQSASSSKFWRNTKKFDTCTYNYYNNDQSHLKLGQKLISPIKDLNLSLSQHKLIRRRYNQSETPRGQNQYWETWIISRQQVVQKSKLFFKYFYIQKYQMTYKDRKKSPTDKDKFHLYLGFKESLNVITKKQSDVSKLFLSNKQSGDIISLQKPISEQTFEQFKEQDPQKKNQDPIHVGRPLSSNYQCYQSKQAVTQRPNTANPNNFFNVPLVKSLPIRDQFNMAFQQPMSVINYQQYQYDDVRSYQTAPQRPASSQYAMALNLDDDNLKDVLQLLKNNSPNQSPNTGVYKPSKQGLRPYSAIKRQTNQPQAVHQQSMIRNKGQQQIFGEQQNLRFVKKVRAMANPIVIKGTKYDSEDY